MFENLLFWTWNPEEHTRRERQNVRLKTRNRIDEWTELLELS